MLNVSQSHKLVKSKKPKKRLVLLAIIAAVGIATVLWLFISRDRAIAPIVNRLPDINKEHDVIRVEANFMFSGTVVPARAVENEARRADGTVDWEQPFSMLDTFNPSQYDAWTVDMECPITDARIPYQTQVANTIFNCRPEFLKPMSKYFTIMNLANNHVYDQGRDKFSQMQQYIQDAGIQHVGNQDPSITKDVCEVMALKVRLIKKNGSQEAATLPIAFCAWHYFEREPYEGEFDVMKQYADVLPVIGLMQVGQEYVATADLRQQTVGRRIIDGGAEFVIGNSPHWVQNSEVHEGKLIFYSTGNFMFDQLNEETNRGASVVARMKLDFDENVAKWLAIGEQCRVHYDQCLQKAKTEKLAKIKPTFTFDLVASTTGYRKLTQKAPADIQAAVEKRANWEQTLKKLGQQ